MLKKLTVLATACALLLAVAVPAQAHIYVDKRTPGKNATVSTRVSQVKAVFTGQIIKGSLSVKRASNGRTVATGGKTDARTVKTNLNGLSRGSYKVTVNITAGDAHKQKFTWTFKVA